MVSNGRAAKSPVTYLTGQSSTCRHHGTLNVVDSPRHQQAKSQIDRDRLAYLTKTETTSCAGPAACAASELHEHAYVQIARRHRLTIIAAPLHPTIPSSSPCPTPPLCPRVLPTSHGLAHRQPGSAIATSGDVGGGRWHRFCSGATIFAPSVGTFRAVRMTMGGGRAGVDRADGRVTPKTPYEVRSTRPPVRGIALPPRSLAALRMPNARTAR